jgi:hypothetical protein
MEAPFFSICRFLPLQFAAIGSGQGAVSRIADYHDMVVAGDPGNSMVEAALFRDAISTFMLESKLPSVGGLLPVLKVSGRGIERLGFSVEMPVGGPKIQLSFDGKSKRWVQHNMTAAKEIPLLHPWEIPQRNFTSRTFDDLLEAQRRFYGNDPGGNDT